MNRILRRQFLQFILAGAFQNKAFAVENEATNSNKKPIEFVLPVAFSSAMSRVIPERIILQYPNGGYFENKLGAGGSIAMRYVSNQPEEKVSILISPPSTNTFQYLVNPNIGLDPDNAFQYIGMMYQVPSVLISGTKAPSSLVQLINFAKQRPKALTFSSNSIGGFLYFNARLLESLFDIEATHIPYSKDHVLPVLSGEVDFAFVDPMSAKQFEGSGKVNILAVSSKNRLDLFPKTPTLREYHSEFVTSAIFGLLGNKSMPTRVRNEINKKLNAVLSQEGLAHYFKSQGAEMAQPNSPTDFKMMLQKDRLFWEKMIRNRKLLSIEI